jgi:hypothetical protein
MFFDYSILDTLICYTKKLKDTPAYIDDGATIPRHLFQEIQALLP